MPSGLGRKPTDLDYGLGEHRIDGDRLGLIDEDELTQRLLRTFTAPSYKPPRLPTVATELLSISQQPDVEFSVIESLLERDAMLAGEVLAVARSVIHTRIRPVTTLREALVRIGLVQLRQVVLQAAMNLRVFRSASYKECMERLRLHCQATAHLSRIFAWYAKVPQDEAFLCGLLHDVGIAGILLTLGDPERGKEAPDLAVLWPAIDAAHAPAGARMVELWGLSPEIVTTVGGHHRVRIDGTDHPMAATVCLAEAFTDELELGFMPDGSSPAAPEELEDSGLLTHGRVDRSDGAVLARARAALKLGDSTIELMECEARAWAKTAAPVAPPSSPGSRGR